jgi:hypothetical protein
MEDANMKNLLVSVTAVTMVAFGILVGTAGHVVLGWMICGLGTGLILIQKFGGD